MSLAIGESFVWFAAGAICVAEPNVALPVSLALLVRLLSLGAPGALMIFMGGHTIIATIDSRLLPLPSILLVTAMLAAVVLVVSQIRRPGLSRVMPGLFLWSLFVVGLAWLRMAPDADNILTQRLTLLSIQLGVGTLLVCRFYARIVGTPRLLLAGALVAVGALVHAAVLGIPPFTRPAQVPLQDIGRCACAGATAIGATTAFHWGHRRSWTAAILTILACAAGTVTLSRQGIWSFALAMIAVTPLVLRGTSSRLVARLSWLAVLPAAGLVALGMTEGIDPQQMKMISDLRITQNPLDAFGTRLEGYRAAWEMFTTRPLLGWGFGAFGQEMHKPQLYPHNVVLEILAEFGLLGLLIWLVPLGFGLLARHPRLPARTRQAARAHKGILLACVSYWFGISSSSYSLPHGSFLFVALLWVPLVWRQPIQLDQTMAGGADDA